MKEKYRNELKRRERRPQHQRQMEQTLSGKDEQVKMEQSITRRKCVVCCNRTIDDRWKKTVEEERFVVVSREAGWKEALINSLIKN